MTIDLSSGAAERILSLREDGRMSSPGAVRLEIDGAIATITNDNPEKHNAFDDEMDAQLFAIVDELAGRNDVRAVIWRGEGKSFSSGRDVGRSGRSRFRCRTTS